MLLTHRDWKSKILIADDQPILRERIREMISSTADMAVIADIGREEDTLRTIALDDPDMLIMDISMEDRNCLETIREI
ncbi:MAG TPA: response regulator, partial [Thermodesulfovibrionales bacterium]|nr:response regulator [Thermodesulfovibrionales bacterium]